MNNPFELLEFKQKLKDIQPDVIEKYRNVLPEFIIDEWTKRNLASYMGGLLQTTNPMDYYDTMSDWTEDANECHVLMRSAFGMLYYLKNEKYYSLDVHDGYISDLQNNFKFVIEFSLKNKDYQNDVLLKKLYQKAVKIHKVPNYDEVFAFVPAIAIGGAYEVENIQLCNLWEHLSFLSQL